MYKSKDGSKDAEKHLLPDHGTQNRSVDHGRTPLVENPFADLGKQEPLVPTPCYLQFHWSSGKSIFPGKKIQHEERLHHFHNIASCASEQRDIVPLVCCLLM